MKDFKNKVVVITGGATGIGYAFAKAFGAEGAKIVIASRREAKVEAAVEQLKALGYEASGTTCDVADYKQVEALADFAWDKYGQVDVLFNNAGVSQFGSPLFDMDMDTFKRVIDINLFGTVHGIKVFGPRMVAQGTQAAIYNLGSENSFFNGVPGAAGYVASKHSVLAVTEALKEEVPDFIDVSMIAPGLVKSEMTEATPIGMEADDFVSRVMPQLKENHFFCVSHAYNMARINDRYEKVSAAYAEYAPRYDNDVEFDVRTLLKMLEEQQGQ